MLWFSFDGLMSFVFIIFLFFLLVKCFMIDTTTETETDETDETETEENGNITLSIDKNDYNCLINSMNELKTLLNTIEDCNLDEGDVSINLEEFNDLNEAVTETKTIIVDSKQ
jgi:hypothetical protein